MLKKILIVHTGGTLAIDTRSKNADTADRFIAEILTYLPEIRKIAELKMVTPMSIDSSNITTSHWEKLGKIIFQELPNYDGIVVIHGTDTMCYTACALSFMISHLNKPIILTGSQLPLTRIRSDARSNLTDAIEMATWPITEVGICFHHKLFRGNRCKKVSIDDFKAISSPNFPFLAKLGLNIQIKGQSYAPSSFKKPELHTDFDNRVMSIRITPSMQSSVLLKLLQSPIMIFVLESFGAGNLPVIDRNMLFFIEEAKRCGKLVVIASQCLHGQVNMNLYETGREIQKRGALSGEDMTVEACVVKSMFLLGLYKGNTDKVRENFYTPLAGELTESNPGDGEEN